MIQRWDREVFLVLCSPFSINRPWINFETGRAWAKKVPIIPICHSGQTIGRLPQPLAQLQALEIANAEFSKHLIKGLSEHFQIHNVPRILHEGMMKELLAAESSVSKFYTGQSSSTKIEKQSSSSEPSLGQKSDTGASKDMLSLRPVRVILTTGITSDDEPENSVSSFSMSDEKICVYIKWFQLMPEKEYDFTYQLLDEIGDILTASQITLRPKSKNWNSWHWYLLKKNIDQPGNWTFRGYLDGNKVAEKEICSKAFVVLVKKSRK